MSSVADLISAIRSDLSARVIPESIEALNERLTPVTTGLTQRVLVAFRDTRMFRIRAMGHRPSHIHEIGPPPTGMPPMGRLNEQGHSVLYLADSPATAFAESRALPGEFCLSEWRVQVEKLALANGGVSPAAMGHLKDIYTGAESPLVPTPEDEKILELLREIYTLDVGGNPQLYRWSIACALANGFFHVCERTGVDEVNGITKWEGRYPFAAIAYPSTRMDRTSLNFALNDLGKSHVQLDHVQWVRRTPDGAHIGLDYANSLDDQGRISWTNRPARFLLKPGEEAKVIKIGQTEWKYETADGSIPWFA